MSHSYSWTPPLNPEPALSRYEERERRWSAGSRNGSACRQHGGGQRVDIPTWLYSRGRRASAKPGWGRDWGGGPGDRVLRPRRHHGIPPRGGWAIAPYAEWSRPSAHNVDR